MTCPLCGSPARVRHTSPLGRTAACHGCGLVFSDPAIDPIPLYDDHYFHHNYDARVDAQRARADRHLARLAGLGGRGALLDYGCGAGVYLEAAAAAGFDPLIGVDTSAAALTRARARLPSSACRLLTPGELDDSVRVEALILIDSLAHMPDAPHVLRALVARHVTPGGLVLVRTPNVDARVRAWGRVLDAVATTAVRDRFYGLPKRAFLFDRPSLTRVLEHAGLAVVRIDAEAEDDASGGGRRWAGDASRLLWQTIPRRLTPDDSLVAIARRAA